MIKEIIKNNIQNIFLFVFWLIIGVYVTVESMRLGLGSLTSPGSGFFPFIAGVGIIFFTIILIIQAMIGKENNNVKYDKQGLKKVLFINLLFLLYIFLIDTVGFVLITFIFLLTFLWMIEKVAFVKSLLITTGTIIIIYFGFTKGLELRLPEGILF